MKVLIIALLVAAAAAETSAQSAARPPASATVASQLGRGWTALANQQPAQAIDLAQQVLRTRPASHDALSLLVAAQVGAGQPLLALDAYDGWLASSKHEDLFLLQPVALGVLRQLAAHKELRVKAAALAALAEAGDAEAQRELQELLSEQNAPAGLDADLAASGDQAAITRLETQIGPKGVRDKSSSIDALARANSKSSAPAIVAALSDPAPPTRMAAANALAELEATDAIPALKKALGDPDPAVRNMIAVALARLGDESSGVTMQSLAQSPIGELRLQAAQAAARQNPQGSWAENVQGLLRDPDPMLKLKAMRVLLEFGRQSEALTAALGAALSDDTPAVRTEAARLLREVSQQQPGVENPAYLRRLLRDRVPDVQIEAARALAVLR
jgi:HEAT repeat protein